MNKNSLAKKMPENSYDTLFLKQNLTEYVECNSYQRAAIIQQNFQHLRYLLPLWYNPKELPADHLQSKERSNYYLAIKE